LTKQQIQTNHLNNVKKKINGDPVKAIEATYRITNAMGSLINYRLTEPHKSMLRTGMLGDKSGLFRIINKGRQGGFSIFQAVESSGIAQVHPNTHQYYVATKEDQAKSWLDKVELMSKNCRTDFDGTPLIDIDTVKSSHMNKVFRHVPRHELKQLKKQIRHSYITGFAASPSGIRGETAIKVILDEFPQMVQRENQQRDVYAAIGYFIAQGGASDIQGTPLVKSDMFWDMYSNCGEYLMKPFYFPIIENWQEIDLFKPLVIELDNLKPYEVDKVMKSGLYDIKNKIIINKVMKDNIAVQKMKIPYPWYDIGFLEQKRREDLSMFKQEILGIPEDVAYRFIIPELYIPRMIAEEHKFGRPDFVYKCGIDVAQRRDLTALTIGHQENGVLVEDFVWDTQSLYPIQKEEIKEICARYPTMDEILLDNTGAGIGLGDMIELDYAFPKLTRVDFRSNVLTKDKQTVKIPEILSLEFKKALTLNKYNALDHPIAKAHVLRIEKIATDSFNIRYSGKRGNKRDDHYWSKTLLNLGFSKDYGSQLGNYKNVGTIGIPADIREEITTVRTPVASNDGMLMW